MITSINEFRKKINEMALKDMSKSKSILKQYFLKLDSMPLYKDKGWSRDSGHFTTWLYKNIEFTLEGDQYYFAIFAHPIDQGAKLKSVGIKPQDFTLEEVQQQVVTFFNQFQTLNEENAVQQQVTNTVLNSDKTTQLTGYENDMGYYNSNKGKLLLLSQKAVDEKTEQEANKIINGNIYLGIAWKMYKMETALKGDEDKLGSNEISQPEKAQIQTNVNTNKQELNKVKKELDDKIRLDLGQIKKM